AEETSLGDRANMAFLGTSIARGTGRGVVVATGLDTQVGQIGALLRSAKQPPTPLEEHLARFGKLVLIVCLLLSGLLFLLGALGGTQPWPVLLLTAVSLAVAAIPEGLPAITTITLGIGMLRMAERGAIVRKLAAVETLGSATTICTDKTGTLTQNAMVVTLLETPDGIVELTGSGYAGEGDLLRDRVSLVEQPSLPEDVRRLLRTAAVCSTAHLVERDGQHESVGDPTEAALLVAAKKANLDRERALGEGTLESTRPFDSTRKRMSVIERRADGRRICHVKGSAESVLPRCDRVLVGGSVEPLSEQERASWLARDDRHAGEALRVLALAEREDPGEDPESGLVFLGLAAMLDPPREGVREAVADCHQAGVDVVMITGDHRLTAKAIATDLGIYRPGDGILTGAELAALPDDSFDARVAQVTVFARVTADQKLRIVEALQRGRHVVAMTGDGVNDAPALRQAAIGVAMGKSGTDVARDASDMVLADDDFATIVDAIRAGRAIFRNIQKFIFFLNSSNAGLVVAVIAASFFPWIPPLLPIQLLWINLITNGLPALALGVDPPHRSQMHEPPRPLGQGVMGWRDAGGIMLVGGVMGLIALGLFWLPEQHPELFIATEAAGRLHEARTMAFALLAISPLFHAHNCRSPHASILALGIFRNRWLWIAITISAAFLALTFLPALRPIFRTEALNLGQWIAVLALSALPIPIVEALKLVERRLQRGAGGRSSRGRDE
ncbi:MAG: HAD-IC family P-type ATPase, partial [Myxococcales bacterium]|nr:HAD-IC family P-type ATPase [Myxococcales bacterium]